MIKTNLFVMVISSLSNCLSSSWDSLLRTILVWSVKARIASSFCSIVLNSRSVCFLHHLVALGVFRRNHWAVSFFRNLIYDPFPRALFGALLWEVYGDWVCCYDPGSSGSGHHDSDPYKVFHFFKDSPDGYLWETITTWPCNKSYNYSTKSGQCS